MGSRECGGCVQTAEAVLTALRLNETELNGRPIRVTRASSKPPSDRAEPVVRSVRVPSASVVCFLSFE